VAAQQCTHGRGRMRWFRTVPSPVGQPAGHFAASPPSFMPKPNIHHLPASPLFDSFLFFPLPLFESDFGQYLKSRTLNLPRSGFFTAYRTSAYQVSIRLVVRWRHSETHGSFSASSVRNFSFEFLFPSHNQLTVSSESAPIFNKQKHEQVFELRTLNCPNVLTNNHFLTRSSTVLHNRSSLCVMSTNKTRLLASLV